MRDCDTQKKPSESHTNRHHRRARKNGGTTNKKNISKVPIGRHKAFHYFFNHTNGKPMHPDSIGKRLQVLFPMMEALFKKEDGQMISFEDFVHELNNMWIDPDYEIVLSEPEKVLSPDPQ